MTDINNTINVPQPGSPRFESDTAKAIGRIRASLGGEGRPYFETLTLGGLTGDSLVYGDTSKVLQSVSLTANLEFSAPTLDTVQDIQVVSSPTFESLTLNDSLTVKGSLGDTAFYVDEDELYYTLTSATVETGNPIGLLLSLTYNIP